MKKVLFVALILAVASCKKEATPIKSKVCGVVIDSRPITPTIKLDWWVSILVDGQVKEFQSDVYYSPKQTACFDGR